MNLNEYQHLALKTAYYPLKGKNILYPAMGLAGESGETLDKIKKYWRNSGIEDVFAAKDLTEEQFHQTVLELGDSLWYICAFCQEMGISLESVANQNLQKLQDRQNRGVINSQGDNR